ncbi:MAG: hypothetical protein ABI045_05590 [Flavobacteriales bacterium]
MHQKIIVTIDLPCPRVITGMEGFPVVHLIQTDISVRHDDHFVGGTIFFEIFQLVALDEVFVGRGKLSLEQYG